MVDEAKTLSFSVISTQPSIQPCIDELLRSLQKRQMYKGSSEGSRNNIFLIASIIIMTVASTPRVSARTEDNQDWTQWKPNHSNPEVLLQTTTRMADIDRISTSAHGENWTPEPQPPFNNHEYQDEEETPHATSTSKKDDALKLWYPTYQRCCVAVSYTFCVCTVNLSAEPERGHF